MNQLRLHAVDTSQASSKLIEVESYLQLDCNAQFDNKQRARQMIHISITDVLRLRN